MNQQCIVFNNKCIGKYTVNSNKTEKWTNKRRLEWMSGMHSLSSECNEKNYEYLSSKHDSARNKVHVGICFKPCISNRVQLSYNANSLLTETFLIKITLTIHPSEPPVTAHAGSTFLQPLVMWSVLTRTILSPYLCRGKMCFKPNKNKHDSVKEARQKGKKPWKVGPQIPMKIVFHYPPTFLFNYNPKMLKPFDTKTFPT